MKANLRKSNTMTGRTLIPFPALSFGFTWTIAAILILGTIIAVWHIPAFLMGGLPLSNWSFVPYFAGVVAIYVILTAFFNASRGSLLVAYLYHFQMMNPIFPDAQPYDNTLWVAIAVIVVWLNRRKMFNREAGITDIIEEPAPSEQLDQAYSPA